MSRRHASLGSIASLLALLAAALAGAVWAQDAAAPTKSLDAASYQLFPTDDHTLTATLQVTETVEGGARIVVSLPGPAPVEAHRAVLYHGDCGPDRPVALLLTPFDEDDDPLSSVTQDEAWTFERLTESDLFAYVFASEDIDRPETAGLDGRALACGEVGVGANR